MQINHKNPLTGLCETSENQYSNFKKYLLEHIDPELEPCTVCGGKAKVRIHYAIESPFFVTFRFSIQCSECKYEIQKPFDICLVMSKDGQIKESSDNEFSIKRIVNVWNAVATQCSKN